MASSAYPFNTHGVGSDTGENQALYEITLTMSGYATTDGNAVAGAVNPASYKDFSSLPTNKNDGLNLARGGVRYAKVLQKLGTHSNYRLLKIQTDSSADQDTAPTFCSKTIRPFRLQVQVQTDQQHFLQKKQY